MKLLAGAPVVFAVFATAALAAELPLHQIVKALHVGMVDIDESGVSWIVVAL